MTASLEDRVAVIELFLFGAGANPAYEAAFATVVASRRARERERHAELMALWRAAPAQLRTWVMAGLEESLEDHFDVSVVEEGMVRDILDEFGDLNQSVGLPLPADVGAELLKAIQAPRPRPAWAELPLASLPTPPARRADD